MNQNATQTVNHRSTNFVWFHVQMIVWYPVGLNGLLAQGHVVILVLPGLDQETEPLSLHQGQVRTKSLLN